MTPSATLIAASLFAQNVLAFTNSVDFPVPLPHKFHHGLTKRAESDFGWQVGNWAYNCDFKGKDLSNVKTSADQCGPTCKSTSGCTHFTWSNYQGGTCWLKTGGATKADAIVTTDTVCGLILPIEWQAENFAMNCDFPGNDVSNAQVATWEQCKADCDKADSCSHFTWTSFQAGTCWIKNKDSIKKADAVSSQGSVCGTKTWGFVMASWLTTSEFPIKSMSSRVVVPTLPSADWMTLFLWPGLEPSNSAHPLGLGVIQPVLTYGFSCAPNPNNLNIDKTKTWWISAQYVNTGSTTLSGCYGGDQMSVNPGESLLMVMTHRSGSNFWDQVVTNESTGKSVAFSFDMQGQEQTWAMWVLEPPGRFHANPPQFTVRDIKIELAGAPPPGSVDFCKTNYFINPEVTGARVECSASVRSANLCEVSECKFNGGA